MEKILITGNLGYIGSVLTDKFLEEDYDIIGLDTNFYRGKKLFDFKFKKEYKQLYKDIRDVVHSD